MDHTEARQPSSTTSADPNRPASATAVQDDPINSRGPLVVSRRLIMVTAICGAALVMAAAISSTTATWADVPIGLRLAGIIGLTALIAFGAERARSTIPASARVLAHLGAALALPTVVSAVATAHGSWRVCTLVAGIAGAAALELQGRRWSSMFMHGAEVAAAVVGAAGGAALLHIPVGVIVSALSIVALLVGLEQRSAGLAAAAASAPLLGALAAVNVGHGTLRELGAAGSALRFAPISGVIAGIVLGVLAHRSPTKRHWLVAGAGAAVISNGLIGLDAANLNSGWPMAWSTLAAFAVVAAWLRSRPLATLVGIVFPVMLAIQLESWHVTTSTIVLLLAVLGATGIGTSLSLDRGLTPLDAFGYTALGAAIVGMPDDTTRTAAILVLSLFTVAYGRMLRNRPLQAIAAFTGFFSAMALAESSRIYLRSVPVWTWCLAAGLGLLALAVAVERRQSRAR